MVVPVFLVVLVNIGTLSTGVTEPYHLMLLDSFTWRYWTVSPGITEPSLAGTKPNHYVALINRFKIVLYYT